MKAADKIGRLLSTATDQMREALETLEKVKAEAELLNFAPPVIAPPVIAPPVIVPVTPRGLPSGMQRILLRRVQPVTVMLSRTGHGENATGGGENYAFVDNSYDLRSALMQGGNHVVTSPRMAGAHISYGETVPFGENTTLNCSLSDGLTFVSGKEYLFRVNEGNSIAHNFISFSNFGNHINFQDGLHHWWDKITIAGAGGSDDGIGFNGSNSGRAPDKVTFSNWRVEPGSFGFIVVNWFNEAIQMGRLGEITIHSCYSEAEQRSGKNDGAAFYHEFNNVMNAVRAGNDTFNDNGNDSKDSINQKARSWIDGNRYINGQMQNGNKRPALRTQGGDCVIFHDRLQMDGSYRLVGNCLNKYHRDYEPHPFLYDWVVLPDDAPNSVITDFAGAD
jgi:hypothetical protein